MTTPQPLTTEGFIEGFNKVWSSKEIWLAAQWLKKILLETDMYFAREHTVEFIDVAFGACRPNTEKKEVKKCACGLSYKDCDENYSEKEVKS